MGDNSPTSDPPTGLTEEQIEEITDLLRAGRRLPPHLFPHLFETSKEYELAYAGKARRADVLADTMSVPLQAVKTFGSNGAGKWSNMVILGDNLQVLRRLLAMKSAGELTTAAGLPGIRLCYIDPPFATQSEFKGAQGERAYQDRVAGAEFVEFLRRRLLLIRELLSEDGSVFVHLDQRKVHYAKVVMDEVFGEANFRNEIILKRPISKNLQRQFEEISALPQGHDTLLWYSGRTSARFRAPEVPTAAQKPEGYWHHFWSGADRPTMRYELLGVEPQRGQWKWRRDRALQAVKNYKRYEKEANGKSLVEFWEETGRELEFIRLGKTGKPENWFPPSETQLASTLWSDLRVYENAKLYPTQKHTELLEYIIETATDPEDIVLDAFAGSGTTLVAAEQLPEPRRWIGIDSGKFAIYVAQARLLRLAGKKPPQRPFTMFNAGLYDYKAVRDLSWPGYRQFALELFQCRPAEEKLGGVTFDGFLSDYRVLVYNFNEHKDATIGRQFVEDIAALCGDRLGSRCFVIAPALAVEPYEDYLDVGETRFFFLRIPYSIIAELHKRAFSELRQPSSADMANATIDSVGFDFIQPPKVTCHYRRKGSDLIVEVTAFSSESFAADPKAVQISDLAMVMLDYDYDGQVFDLDAVHYGEDLADEDWQLAIPEGQVGKQVMLIYLDVYGNEHRETKSLADFKDIRRKPTKSRQPGARGKKAPAAAKKPAASKRRQTAAPAGRRDA